MDVVGVIMQAPQSVNAAKSEHGSTHHTLAHNSFNEGKDACVPPTTQDHLHASTPCDSVLQRLSAADIHRFLDGCVQEDRGLIDVTTMLPDCSSFLCFSPRMDDPFCLSALRSPFYSLPTGGALPPIHPSAVHMHLPGVRYPGDFTHPSLSALQSAER